MIKFFRKIRQRLLTENKFSKYLLYAIGEILLVMIGILLALRVNTWNQNRINNISQDQYLYRIKADINKDLGNLIYLKNRHKERIEKVNRFIDYLGKKHIEQGTFNNLYWSTHHADDFIESDDTFKDMVNSAKIDLIRNDSLKINIIELYSHFDKINKYEEHLELDNRENIYNLSIKLFDWDIVTRKNDREAFDNEFHKISSNLQIKNSYILFSSVASVLTDLYNTGIINIQELDSAIMKELKK